MGRVSVFLQGNTSQWSRLTHRWCCSAADFYRAARSFRRRPDVCSRTFAKRTTAKPQAHTALAADGYRGVTRNESLAINLAVFISNLPSADKRPFSFRYLVDSFSLYQQQQQQEQQRLFLCALLVRHRSLIADMASPFIGAPVSPSFFDVSPNARQDGRAKKTLSAPSPSRFRWPVPVGACGWLFSSITFLLRAPRAERTSFRHGSGHLNKTRWAIHSRNETALRSRLSGRLYDITRVCCVCARHRCPAKSVASVKRNAPEWNEKLKERWRAQ